MKGLFTNEHFSDSDVGRRPELKSDEFSGTYPPVIEIISLLCEIARDNWCSNWRRDPALLCAQLFSALKSAEALAVSGTVQSWAVQTPLVELSIHTCQRLDKRLVLSLNGFLHRLIADVDDDGALMAPIRLCWGGLQLRNCSRASGKHKTK